MNAREFFNSEVLHNFGHSSSYGDWTRHYWSLEFVTAEMNECQFSVLEDYQQERERTCEMCGAVHETNEYGRIDFCVDKTCSDLRQYFGFTSGQRPFLANGKIGSTRHKRASWLRRKLGELYGEGRNAYSIYGLPIDCRMPVLLSMQIAREQIESSRTTGNVGEADYFAAPEPKQRKQSESDATYGICSSVH